MDRVAQSKLIIFPLCLAPLVALILAAQSNQLGADPAHELTLELGEWGLRFLLISLAVTPIRRMTGFNKIIRYRRMLGLFALFYASLHLLSYLSFMLAWEWDTLLEDLYKRTYIVVGAAALSILMALGATSSKKVMRLMGRSWQKLHKLVYFAAALVILHFAWLVKSDYSEPFVYGFIFLLLMVLRVVPKQKFLQS